jgi:hypothetical protein
VRQEGLGEMKKLIHLVGSRTRDLQFSSVQFPHQQYTCQNAERTLSCLHHQVDGSVRSKGDCSGNEEGNDGRTWNGIVRKPIK